MELRWIEAFIAVAEELHFGRAAERMRMAQSPLSQTIIKLEKDLGTSLFDRNTRAVALTAAGHAFLPHARKVMDDLDLARRASRTATAGVFGHVNIGFSGALNHLTLPPLTRALRKRYPDISLTLVDRIVTSDAVQHLGHGTLDLSFVGMPVNAPGIASRLISREVLGVTLSADHRLAREKDILLSDLADDDFVAMPLNRGSAHREAMMHACLDAGFRPNIVQEVIDPFMVLSLVAAGVGVSLMPVGVSSIIPSGAVSVPLRGEPAVFGAGLAWAPSNVSAALNIVLAVAEEVLPTPGE